MILHTGDILTIKPGDKHTFWCKQDCVFEEISSRHILDDSYYSDKSILKNKDRKSFINLFSRGIGLD